MITYLNSDNDLLKARKRGELRLYLKEKIVDVIPRLGRTIAFNSTRVEHEVRPTLNYERFAVTTWLHAEPQKIS